MKSVVALAWFLFAPLNLALQPTLSGPQQVLRKQLHSLQSTEVGNNEIANNVVDDANNKRMSLKRDLLTLAASYDRGYGASTSAWSRVDNVITALEALNEESNASRGVEGSVASPLSGSWRMIWTTAADVLVLGASPVVTVGAIYQIFGPLPVVTNVIDFIPRVQALLPPSIIPASLIRASVQTKASLRPGYPNRVGLWFEAVKIQPIQLFGLSASQLPPFAANLPKIPGTSPESNQSGPGYFDVTYLDRELLIIRQNAPGGLFALVKVEDSQP